MHAPINVNPLLSKVNYEAVEITPEMILYGLSDSCAIHDGLHPLFNLKLCPSSSQTSKNLTRIYTTHVLEGEERRATKFSPLY